MQESVGPSLSGLLRQRQRLINARRRVFCFTRSSYFDRGKEAEKERYIVFISFLCVGRQRLLKSFPVD